MLIITQNAEEEASAYRALAVINQLRRRDTTYTVRPNTEDDAPWVHTKNAKPEYL